MENILFSIIKDYIISNILPIILFFILLYRFNDKRTLIFSFFSGVFTVFFAVLFFEFFSGNFIKQIFTVNSALILAIIIVFIEELFKLIAFALNNNKASSRFVVVLSIVIGFAVTETFLYTINSGTSLVLRNFTSFLVHLISLSFTAIYWKKKIFIFGFFQAIAFHLLYNLFLNSGQLVMALVSIIIAFLFLVIEYQIIRKVESAK